MSENCSIIFTQHTISKKMKSIVYASASKEVAIITKNKEVSKIV